MYRLLIVGGSRIGRIDDVCPIVPGQFEMLDCDIFLQRRYRELSVHSLRLTLNICMGGLGSSAIISAAVEKGVIGLCYKKCYVAFL